MACSNDVDRACVGPHNEALAFVEQHSSQQWDITAVHYNGYNKARNKKTYFEVTTVQTALCDRRLRLSLDNFVEVAKIHQPYSAAYCRKYPGQPEVFQRVPKRKLFDSLHNWWMQSTTENWWNTPTIKIVLENRDDGSGAAISICKFEVNNIMDVNTSCKYASEDGKFYVEFPFCSAQIQWVPIDKAAGTTQPTGDEM